MRPKSNKLFNTTTKGSVNCEKGNKMKNQLVEFGANEETHIKTHEQLYLP